MVFLFLRILALLSFQSSHKMSIRSNAKSFLLSPSVRTHGTPPSFNVIESKPC
jgi:hypothetical protein